MATKRVLLIASSYDGLRSPPNDIAIMAGALSRKGFDVMAICAGEEATRDGILNGWRSFNKDLSSSDVAVVYYSGHGGLVEQPNNPALGSGQARSGPRQFLVPVNSATTTPDDFLAFLTWS
jgi:uncharacterized caspase-like protein